MKSVTVSCSVLALVLFGGCIVPSLHPLYTEDKLVFEAALIGEWTEENDQVWTFTKKEEKAYQLVISGEDAKSATYEAHLAKINDTLFLDLFADDPDIIKNEMYVGFVIPTHMFMKVDQIGPTLSLRILGAKWLEKLLDKEPDAIQYEEVEDMILLTASPKDLQAFVLKYKDTEDAFGDPIELTRSKAAKKIE